MPALLQASPVTAVRAGAGGFMTEAYPICTANVEGRTAASCLTTAVLGQKDTGESGLCETPCHLCAYVTLNKYGTVGDHSQVYELQLQLIDGLKINLCFFMIQESRSSSICSICLNKGLKSPSDSERLGLKSLH